MNCFKNFVANYSFKGNNLAASQNNCPLKNNNMQDNYKPCLSKDSFQLSFKGTTNIPKGEFDKLLPSLEKTLNSALEALGNDITKEAEKAREFINEGLNAIKKVTNPGKIKLSKMEFFNEIEKNNESLLKFIDKSSPEQITELVDSEILRSLYGDIFDEAPKKLISKLNSDQLSQVLKKQNNRTGQTIIDKYWGEESRRNRYIDTILIPLFEKFEKENNIDKFIALLAESHGTTVKHLACYKFEDIPKLRKAISDAQALKNSPKTEQKKFINKFLHPELM